MKLVAGTGFGSPRFVCATGGCRAFTLMEVMVASSMTALLVVCVLFGVITLQHSYVSTQEYGAGQADQARLLDCLSLDLRRGIQATGAITPYTLDADGQGMQITVPDYYRFSAADPQHLSPMPARPTYDATTDTAYYNGSGSVTTKGAAPCKVIAYRFNAADGSITRSDPWQPLAPDGKGGYAAAPMVIATNMEAFPVIKPDASDISGNVVHYSVAFRSTLRPLSTTSDGTEITLHNVTFVRSKNLTR